MVKTVLPFEIHLTVDSLPLHRQDAFVNFCFQNDAKPLFIQLSKGDFINQPMLGKVVHCYNLNDVLSISNNLSSKLLADNFEVKRLKIEIPSECADLIQFDSGFTQYFEWHGKVNYINTALLLQICETHKAHISSNSLKNEEGFRFITLREFGTKEQFERRVINITTAINKGWNMIKQESEYCIYDNNHFLDSGWLPQ